MALWFLCGVMFGFCGGMMIVSILTVGRCADCSIEGQQYGRAVPKKKEPVSDAKAGTVSV